MPRLDIDMFDDAPKIGDEIKVMGKVKRIDEDSGEVEVSYDDVTIVDKKKKRKSYSDDNEDTTMVQNMDTEMSPNTQSLDYALSQSFPPTQ